MLVCTAMQSRQQRLELNRKCQTSNYGLPQNKITRCASFNTSPAALK